MTELWSWVLTMFGLTGMWLAGRKVWWTWFVSLAGQVVWFIYALTTTQWGFIHEGPPGLLDPRQQSRARLGTTHTRPHTGQV